MVGGAGGNARNIDAAVSRETTGAPAPGNGSSGMAICAASWAAIRAGISEERGIPTFSICATKALACAGVETEVMFFANAGSSNAFVNKRWYISFSKDALARTKTAKAPVSGRIRPTAASRAVVVKN